jgi:hypothetical protein
MDKVNALDLVILGKTYAAKTLRCADYSIEAVWEKGASGGLEFYWQLTVQAEYNPRGWQPKILSTGRRAKVTILGTDYLIAIVDEAGQPVSEPVPLGAAGLPVGPTDSYAYVTPKGYVEANWLGTGGTLWGAGGLLE